MKPRRIVVVGTTGSGKSTLASLAGQKLGVPMIELDGLFWLPDWTPCESQEFRRRVSIAIEATHWTVAGNYSVVRDLVWERADTVVWLDYPLMLNFWRLFKRALIRRWTNEDLWNTGNHESLYETFFTSRSLFVWAMQTYYRRKREYPQIMADPTYAHLHIVHLRYPWEAEQWLKSL